MISPIHRPTMLNGNLAKNRRGVGQGIKFAALAVADSKGTIVRGDRSEFKLPSAVPRRFDALNP